MTRSVPGDEEHRRPDDDLPQEAPELVALLYDRYFPRLYGYLCALLNDRAEAEDVSHEVFEALLDAISRDRLPRARSVRAWLFTVARHRAIDHRRKHGRIDLTAPFEMTRRVGRSAAAEPEAVRHVFDPDLAAAIRRLPSLPREVVLLRYVADLDLAAIAALIGITEDSVKQAHRRALITLRERLGSGFGPSPSRPLDVRARFARGERMYSSSTPMRQSRRFLS